MPVSLQDSLLTAQSGVNGLMDILFSLIGIAVCWYVLGSVKWELFVRHPHSLTGRLLRLVIAIILGTQVASFCMHYLQDTQVLRGFYH